MTKIVKKGTFKIDVYGTSVDIFIMDTAEDVVPQVEKIIKKHKGEIDDRDMICDGYAVIIEEDPLKGYLVYCRESLSINIITHETDHMRKYILDFKDIEDHEASANLNGYINQEVCRFIIKAGFVITY